MRRDRSVGGGILGRLLQSFASLGFAAGLVLVVFLVLPFMQQVSRPPETDLDLRPVGMANLPAPPPPPPEEEPEEEVEEEAPPEFEEAAAPLDLSQLELALNPGIGDGVGGDFAVRLPGAAGEDGAAADEADAIFSLADLDQAPRVVYQPAPEYPAELRRKKTDGTVYLLFLVDRGGRVADPIVQQSTHPAFDEPALRAVRRWRFEPGKRNGQAVQFRMRVPITFMGG